MPDAYRPFVPARRPGGRPDFEPRYRVLIHHQYLDLWHTLVDRVGVESAQQFWDHVALTPGQPPAVNRATIMKGRSANPIGPGFSRTVHYEISGAGRINYQFNDAFDQGRAGDPHSVVFILTINLTIKLGSH